MPGTSDVQRDSYGPPPPPPQDNDPTSDTDGADKEGDRDQHECGGELQWETETASTKLSRSTSSTHSSTEMKDGSLHHPSSSAYTGGAPLCL